MMTSTGLIGKIVMPTLLIFCLMIAADAASESSRAQAGESVAWMNDECSKVEWEPEVSYERLVLTVSGPGSLIIRKEFESGVNPSFEPADQAGGLLPDGQYTYELQAIPVVPQAVREAMASARESGDTTILAELEEKGLLPERSLVQSGHFSIVGGTILTPTALDEEAGPRLGDVLHYDDVIITGSLCIGFDCQDGESFGFDTVMLKEHNLRIYFNDTSATASYPANSWRITVNDSTNGGASYFSIDDADEGTSPFRIEAGAPNHALYVEDYGRVGLGTSTPVVELHIRDSDTPTVRLEQDSSGGWAAQTWDVAGNESNFFIRDATNGSKLPFRIQPGTPSSTLCLKSDGDVGIGTWSPGAPLHVSRSDGTAGIIVEENSSIVERRHLLELRNNGAPGFVFLNTSSGDEWRFSQNADGDFVISLSASGGPEMKIWKSGAVRLGPGGVKTFHLSETGNLEIAGTLTQGSDVNAKENITPVDGQLVLARLRSMPISMWSFKADEPETRHLGPMGQDFYAAFGLGADDRHIAPMDAAGVALAAVKELSDMVQERDKRIAELEKRLSALEQMLEKSLVR
jgi:hypothetical protein